MISDEERAWAEAQGYKVYDHAGDACGFTEAEKQLVDVRITLAKSIRKRREKLGMSQEDLAARLGVSKRRVAKIEWADPAVSFDEIFNAHAVVGGRVGITELPPHANGHGAVKRKRAQKV